MAYRNKTYVAFDGDSDMRYYRLMTAWKANENVNFNFYNAHDLNSARDTSSEQQIKRQLRERMKNSKLFILLVGEKTKNLFKFVRWEIEQALTMDLPIIVVNLNGKKSVGNSLCPPILRNKLAIHIPYRQKIIEYAINNWPRSHEQFKRENKTGAYSYKDSIYSSLGIF